MHCMVTGAAGFIGSHLCEALIAEGNTVIGVDAFIPYYPRTVKEQNLTVVRNSPGFVFRACDLRTDDLADILDGVAVIFHLAATPGLLLSWTDFDLYMTCNIQATHRLLEAARAVSTIRAFIHASTSSIYGSNSTGPEETKPSPVSPYGITKLAAEHLVETYRVQFGLPTSILRYFSVYGPRQRPDMGYHIFIDRMLHRLPITIFGDGNQLRGNTYVTDIVRATKLAAEQFRSGSIYNVGGSEEISANQVIRLLGEIIGVQVATEHAPTRPGEQRRALADTTSIRQHLGFTPQISLREGLAAQVSWQRSHQRAAPVI